MSTSQPYTTIRYPIPGFTPDLKLCIYHALLTNAEMKGVVSVERVVRDALFSIGNPSDATAFKSLHPLKDYPREAKLAILMIAADRKAILLRAFPEALNIDGMFLASTRLEVSVDSMVEIMWSDLTSWKQEFAKMR